MKLNDEFLNSDHWRIKKLDEMGLFNQDIINYLSRYTGKSKEEIIKALKQIGIDTIDLENLNRLFEDEVLKINPNNLLNNYTIQNIINSAYNEVSNTFIQMSSKIEEGARNAYLKVVEEAYLKTAMGTHSYQEAIRTAINDLGNRGITTLTYKTTDNDGNVVGLRNYDIEGAARREILTAARQLSGNINMQLIEELQPEYIYLSEHLECRPTHFDWQGTIIKREDLVEVTDYGDVGGLYGINCRHYAEPYFGTERGNELKQFTKKECTDAYNKSQKQRYLERGVRMWQRKMEMFKVNGDVDSYQKSKEKVKEWQTKSMDYAETNKLKRDHIREYVKTTSNKEMNLKVKAKIDNMKVGTFDIAKYTEDIKTTTKDVILTPKQRKHIIDKHPDVEKYIENISDILQDPDKVFLQLDKEDTLWLIKQLDDEIKVTMKINTPSNIKEKGYKNSIIQMQIMKQNRINNYIEKGKLKQLFDKNDVK